MKGEFSVGVLLKGGLGNQLFQIASGLYFSGGKPLEIYGNFTLPRKTEGVADSLFFNWPGNVVANRMTSNKIEKKFLALSLNLAQKRKVSKCSRVKSQLVKILVNSLFTFKFKERTQVLSGEGVGFCQVKIKPGRNLLNGYFQAHQFPFSSDVYHQIRDIRLKDVSPSLEAWIRKAESENPIIVHLRLGDYKQESGIGVLTPDYYKIALQELESKNSSKNIWIFTDEMESVNEFISLPPTFNVSVIGENGLNPAETLELMRHGSAYVIANSTFSWWAAFLSYQSGCTKIMPAPWFQNMPSPIGIKPQDWIEIEFLKQ
jgi:hypothetical protein